jgi:hypothetical protein
MTARHWSAVLILVTGLTATVAESQSVQVGTLRGDVPPDATVGALRGPVAPSAGVGSFSGSFSPSPESGGLQGFRGAVGAPLGAARAGDSGLGALQGSIPLAATTGALAEPAPPGSFFGAPTPEDIARRNEALADVYLRDVSPVAADAALDRATEIRKETLGPVHPGVAQGLENQARLLERHNRTERAAELQREADRIRKEAERRPPAR